MFASDRDGMLEIMAQAMDNMLAQVPDGVPMSRVSVAFNVSHKSGPVATARATIRVTGWSEPQTW